MPEYNYSPLFLKAHERLVRQLVELARESKVAEIAFDTADEARRARHLISNLKRSLAINHPEMLPVYESLRTEVRYRDERYIIAVGPKHLLTNRAGRPASLDLMTRAAPPTDRSVTLPTISVPKDAIRFAELLRDPSVNRIIVTEHPLEENRPPMSMLPGWELESEDPFILKRASP